MSNLILFNKPFNVLSQFTDEKEQRQTLAHYLTGEAFKGFYPAGRLDYDSEGLMLLTNDGKLQNRIASPEFKLPKTYWVQVEGTAEPKQLHTLQQGVELKDGKTKPAKASAIEPPHVWQRTPAIRERANIPTSWIELTITEGRNRQVRRMTAAVGLPTLRLIRVAIGSWRVENLMPGQYLMTNVSLPATSSSKNKHKPVKQRRKFNQ